VIVVKPDDLVKPEDAPTENKKIGDAVVGTQNQAGDEPGIGSDVSGPKGGTSVVPTIPSNDKPALYVDQPPTIDDLNGYLNRTLKYPEMARANNIEGRVIIKFVVNEDGSVSDAVVMRGIGGGCDEEALRVVRAMPKWKPGRQNGIAVKVYFNLPIVFKLD
jgi:protein TonB